MSESFEKNEIQVIFNLHFPPNDELKEFVDKNPGCYFPMDCGSVLNDRWSVSHLTKDNTGDNISAMNGLVNEFTSIYWFWKNVPLPDYVGFNHYRRYFRPGDFSDFKNWDIIVAKPVFSDAKLSLFNHYKHYHFVEDMVKFCDILQKKSFGLALSFGKYVTTQTRNLAPCNLFIMRKELFEEWCGLAFPILFETVKEVCRGEEFESRHPYQKRCACFLMERFFNFWYHMKISSGVRAKEIDFVERLDFKTPEQRYKFG
jgi:hypothetical protein